VADLWEQGGRALPDIMAEDTEAMVTKVASSVVERKVDGALSKVGDTLGEPAEKVARSATTKAAGALGRVVTKASDPLEDPGQD